MINPNPVETNKTPYKSNRRSQSQGNLPRSISPKTSKKRNWKRILGLSFLFIIVACSTYVYAQISSFKNKSVVDHEGDNTAVLTETSPDKLNPDQFKMAGDGRFNVLILGIGGSGHPGGSLTDSIQLMSVDTINKKTDITSVPRDLYVKANGASSKINSVYQTAESNKKGSGGLVMRQTVGSVLGITISNFVMIDFTGAKNIVDTLGGVDVNVPKALYDPLFPNESLSGYAPFSISAGVQHMSGTTALKYSRSRETTSDFDRSARQQLVIEAIKKKALSLGTLSNPAKINKLTSDLGDHIKTDLQPSQLLAFVNIYRDISPENSSSAVLDTSEKLGLLTSANNPNTGYIAYPRLGYSDFSEIHTWFQKNNPDPLIALEATSISVIAGSNTSDKQVKTLVDTLNDYGYKAIVATSNSSKSKYTKTTIFDTTKGKKSFSRNYLKTQLQANVDEGHPFNTGSDIEIIYIPAKVAASVK